MKGDTSSKIKRALCVLCAMTLAGCADYTNRQALKEPDVKADPNEGFNRAMFAIHNALDNVIIRPVTSVYRWAVPETPRGWVSNFVHNLGSPVFFVNSVLQGDPNNSFATFWRFSLNTTVGLGGLLDVASESGLKARDADFGQTLAVWGVPSGSYVFIPVFGPGTLRDTTGRFIDLAFNPTVWIHPTWYSYAQAGITIVDTRSRNYTLIDDINRSSLDPYATYRSGFLQRRTAVIKTARDVHAEPQNPEKASQ